MTYTYFLILAGTIIFPLAWSFEKKIHFYKKWKYLFPAILITAVGFCIWDEIFTSNQIWGFNNKYITGFKLLNMPIEEILFFIIVPYSCLFIYECVGYFLFAIHSKNNISQKLTYLIGFFLVFMAIFNSELMYTFWSFILSGTLLIYVAYKNPIWITKFWTAYCYHLIPFFIINGLLTGSFIEEEVVWYNNNENLSIRIFTIPVEDTVYSLLLFLVNINLYEQFRPLKLQ